MVLYEFWSIRVLVKKDRTRKDYLPRLTEPTRKGLGWYFWSMGNTVSGGSLCSSCIFFIYVIMLSKYDRTREQRDGDSYDAPCSCSLSYKYDRTGIRIRRLRSPLFLLSPVRLITLLYCSCISNDSPCWVGPLEGQPQYSFLPAAHKVASKGTTISLSL